MQKITDIALKNRPFFIILGLLVLGGGLTSFMRLPVDAFPDVTPPLVQVFTETEGLAPEEVEKYVTYPVEVAMNGLPAIEEIRSVSNFGLSVVNIYFEEGTDIYFARQLVGERLQQARGEIPEGFGEPEMGPISTGLGLILYYYLEDETGERTLLEMREIQDWIIKYNLQTVPGVTEVLSLGGHVKQYHVVVNPDLLLRYDLTLPEVVAAIRANNQNVGGQYIVRNSEQFVVRSVGLVGGIEDLENIVLKSIEGTPVYLKQIADMRLGGEVRQGLATMNGRGEAVVAMVLKLIGTNSSGVIEGVRERLDAVNRMLPPGVKVRVYYDQAALVQKSIRTVTDALLQGILLVALILFVFMGALRPSFVVALSIPFSISFAFLAMKFFGISANLMSFGGLVIAIGMMVDAAIVMVENMDRYLRESGPEESGTAMISRAAGEVLRPVTFAILIIVVVFIPLFTLEGVEGKMFRPLACTTALAMLGSLLYALFLAPVAASFLMKKGTGEEKKKKSLDERITGKMIEVYEPLVRGFVRHRKRALVLAGGMLVTGMAVFPRLGSEFVPRLDEGDLLIRLTMAPSISLEKGKEVITLFEKRLLSKFPEVEQVITRLGRGEAGAHADPVNNAEAFVGLKPRKEWKTAANTEDLLSKMAEEFEGFPGVLFNFTQPIEATVDELLTGTKAELAARLFGPDLEVLAEKSREIESVLRTVRGAHDVQRDQISGAPQLKITVNRRAISRYGINVRDVQDMIRIAVGGEKAGRVFEGVKKFDILVRYVPEARTRPEEIERILVTAPGGVKVPLGDLARVEEITGPRQLTRENNQRFMTVQANVRERDIGSFVEEARRKIEKEIDLPPGYFVNWGGQFELQQKANRRLRIVIPVTLFLVFLLLYANFDSVSNSLLILFNIPLALVGGIAALWISGQNLSVPTSVGFIALFGIALENGMVLVSCLNQLVREGLSIDEASVKGACLRLRAILMTAATTALGLVPLLFSTGTGSEIQRPLATVVVGGLVSSTILTLLVIPALYKAFTGRGSRVEFLRFRGHLNR